MNLIYVSIINLKKIKYWLDLTNMYFYYSKTSLIGWRTVDIFYLFKQITIFQHEGGFDCVFTDIEYNLRKVNGFLICIKLHLNSNVKSVVLKWVFYQKIKKADYLCMNKAVLNGTIVIGKICLN